VEHDQRGRAVLFTRVLLLKVSPDHPNQSLENLNLQDQIEKNQGNPAPPYREESNASRPRDVEIFGLLFLGD